MSRFSTLSNPKKHRRFFPFVWIALLFVLVLSITQRAALAKPVAGFKLAPQAQSDSLSVGDFFLTEEELPPGIINDSGLYDPAAHMNVKGKLMGSQWWSVRPLDTATNVVFHVHIGLFPTEADAIKYTDPDTYIFQTDAYAGTGQTINDLIQAGQQYSVAGGTVYGDGGFSGGYQHQKFQPFNVFRVGRALFHVDASEPSGEGVLEPILVEKARRLQNLDGSTDNQPPTAESGQTQPPTQTPEPQAPPIVLRASLNGVGESLQTIPNPNNFGAVVIDGRVTDQDGNGVGGAAVTVSSGADSASSISNPDGSYSLTVNVPGGQDSGAVQDINFTLQVSDLSIDRIVLLQAIEGGQLVAYRDVGVRVFLNWGLNDPVDVEVTVTVDDQALPSVKGVAKKEYTHIDHNRGTDAVNLVIPKDRFPSWGDSAHTITAQVKILSSQFVDADPSNNTSAPQTFSLKNTDALSILYVSLDKRIAKPALVSFAARAHSFLDKVYPVQYSWGFVGNQQVSYYLVSPYVNFMKSLDADDLPFNLGDVGVVEGGLEVGKSFSYKSAIVAVEKARRLYNTQRCKDPQGKLILPCPDEVALHAVGVYPEGAFGASKDGFAYADRRNEWRAAANSQAKPDNVAHELGHLFGFDEEYSSSSIGVPVTGSTWDGIRFQTADGSCVNIMGNIGLACPWINAQTWNYLIEDSLRYGVQGGVRIASLSVPASAFEPLYAEVQSPALLVQGVVTSEGKGFIQSVSSVDRYESGSMDGPFGLAARDASGNILGEIGFDGLFFDLDSNPVSVSPFLVVLPVPDPAQVADVTLNAPGLPLVDSIQRSISAPQVGFDPLPDAIQDQATLTWQASDADGDPLSSTLYYSNNGGLSWQLLGLEMPVTSYDLDAAELPGGSALFKVVVSDGFNTAESISTPVSMPDQAPIITILHSWGTEFEHQEPISIDAVAYDLEDGLLPPDAIQWFDAQGNLVGTGKLLQTTALAEGTHQISAQARDSTGKISIAGLAIIISGDPQQVDRPASLNINNPLYLWVLCLCALLMVGALLVFGILLLQRRKKASQMPEHDRIGQAIQDQGGNWWYQDSSTAAWYIWNGQVWQPVPGAAPRIVPPRSVPAPAPKSRRAASYLLTLIVGGLVALLVIVGITLVAYNFFPAYHINPGQGDLTQILKLGGGGLLAAIFGLFMLAGGFRTLLTRRAMVEDEWGRRTEKSGCSAILNGLGQLFFGLLFLSSGLALMTLSVYQEILPWLGL